MATAKTKSASKSTTKASSKAKSTSATKAKITKAKSTKVKTTKAKTTKATAKAKTGLSKLDETGNRKGSERRKVEAAAPVKRRKTSRRRQIDPTTCERDYTDQEIQFMHAMDEYKQLSGRMFPTCSEILEVLNKLGYRQIADAQLIYDPNAEVALNEDDDSDEDGDEVESCI